MESPAFLVTALKMKITSTERRQTSQIMASDRQNTAQILIGRRVKTKDPKVPGYRKIIPLTKSTPYFSLSPYSLKDSQGTLIENVWQFSKVYKKVPKIRQTYSRWDQRVIWAHPAEEHLREMKLMPEYWAWRTKGFQTHDAVRYPVGIKHRKTCEYSVFAGPEGYEQLGYVDARKKIYVPLYIQAIQQEKQFLELKLRLQRGEKLLIIDVDGPHEESSEYYCRQYGDRAPTITNNTMEARPKWLKLLLDDPKHPFGHGYCLAAALLGIKL